MIEKAITRVRIGALTSAELMRHMFDGPHTVLELANETGLHEATVRAYLRALRKVNLVRITDWTFSEGVVRARCVPVWAWEPDKPNKRRPKMSDAKRSAEYRARKKERERHAALLFSTPAPDTVCIDSTTAVAEGELV